MPNLVAMFSGGKVFAGVRAYAATGMEPIDVHLANILLSLSELYKNMILSNVEYLEGTEHTRRYCIT